MKKTMFTVVLLIMGFGTLFGQAQTKTEAVAAKFTEGDYYAYQFEQYKEGQRAELDRLSGRSSSSSQEVSRTRPQPRVLGSDGSSSKKPKTPTTITRRYGEAIYVPPTGVEREFPSEQDIDRAIAAYEAALKLEPSGTWKVPSKEYRESLLPPEGGVNARLAEAQKRKQRWVTEEKPDLEKKLAAAAEAERKLQEQLTPTLGDNDFEIKQNSDNTITITGFKLKNERTVRDRYSVVVPFTEVVIPERIYGLPVTRISAGTFKSIEMNSVVIPNSVTEIENYVFNSRNTPGLTSVTLPAGLTSIGEEAFDMNELTAVTIPNNVTTIGRRAFANNKITSVILPARLTSIGEGAFDRNQLTSVTLPAGLKEIGSEAFANNKITSVTIISSVGVSGGVFRNNPITRITLPANLNNVSLYGFEGNFITFYEGQGKAAGTYTKNGPIWARSTAGGID